MPDTEEATLFELLEEKSVSVSEYEKPDDEMSERMAAEFAEKYRL